MKTKIRNIAIALTFVFGAFAVNATGLMNPELMGMNDRNLEVEAWMLNESNFESGDSETEGSTVVEIAVSNPDFSILVDAVKKAGLVDALSADGPFTVFAPTNAAFENLFSQLGVDGVKDLSAEQLMPILTYHVVSGKVMSTDLSNTKVSTLSGDNKLKVNISDGVMINESKVVAADIEGKNGVVHVIDKVLIP
jgi:transforming growth factor-beta-induced protein